MSVSCDFCSIPNITVVSPADCAEIFKVVEAAANHQGPMYIRLTGAVGNPPVYTEDYEFKLGKAIVLKEPNDVTFIACGTMVHEALEASKLLLEQGIQAGVINMHTIKPLDKETLDNALERSKVIITVEEHSVLGGLGSAVAEYNVSSRQPCPQLIIGLPDMFDVSGEYSFLLNRHGLVAGATGTGKTKTAKGCIESVMKVGSTLTVITAPYEHIAIQWVEELTDYGPILASSSSDWETKVKLAKSERTLKRIKHFVIVAVQKTASGKKFEKLMSELLPVFENSLFVGDEVHGLGASSYQSALNPQF
jgi:transketolase